jgi:hypothetical protein
MRSTIAVIFLLERVEVAQGEGSEKERMRDRRVSQTDEMVVGGERKRAQTQSVSFSTDHNSDQPHWHGCHFCYRRQDRSFTLRISLL